MSFALPPLDLAAATPVASKTINKNVKPAAVSAGAASAAATTRPQPAAKESARTAAVATPGKPTLNAASLQQADVHNRAQATGATAAGKTAAKSGETPIKDTAREFLTRMIAKQNDMYSMSDTARSDLIDKGLRKLPPNELQKVIAYVAYNQRNELSSTTCGYIIGRLSKLAGELQNKYPNDPNLRDDLSRVQRLHAGQQIIPAADKLVSDLTDENTLEWKADNGNKSVEGVQKARQKRVENGLNTMDPEGVKHLSKVGLGATKYDAARAIRDALAAKGPELLTKFHNDPKVVSGLARAAVTGYVVNDRGRADAFHKLKDALLNQEGAITKFTHLSNEERSGLRWSPWLAKTMGIETNLAKAGSGKNQ